MICLSENLIHQRFNLELLFFNHVRNFKKKQKKEQESRCSCAETCCFCAFIHDAPFQVPDIPHFVHHLEIVKGPLGCRHRNQAVKRAGNSWVEVLPVDPTEAPLVESSLPILDKIDQPDPRRCDAVKKPDTSINRRCLLEATSTLCPIVALF